MPFIRTACSIPLLIVALFISTATLAQSNVDETDNAKDSPKVVMRTTMGDIVIQLDADRAPNTVENFLAYVDDGFYTDTVFHRVIDGFMIQGGGFTTNFQRKTTRPPVSNEAYNGLRNRRYSIAMARTTAPHSATSQFFINSEDNSNLDHTGTTQRGWGYTVFGRVVQGKDVVDSISSVRTGPGGPFSRDVPKEEVVILGVDRWSAVAGDGTTPASATDLPDEPAKGAAEAADPSDGVIKRSNASDEQGNKRVNTIEQPESVSSDIIKQN